MIQIVGMLTIVACAAIYALRLRLSRRRRTQECLADGICPTCGSESVLQKTRTGSELVKGLSLRPGLIYVCRECIDVFDVPRQVVERRIREAMSRKIERRVEEALREEK